MTNFNSTIASLRRNNVLYWLILLCACAVFYYMNLLTTLKEDDMGFALLEAVWRHIGSFDDLVQSYCNHYMHANGRTANLIATVFMVFLGKPLFNVLNTLVFGVMLHTLSRLCTGRNSVMVFTMFLAFIGTKFPVPGETMLWLDGSLNYMWSITGSLLLVLYLLNHKNSQVGWGKGVLLLLAAIIAGSFNEATSFGFFGGLFLYYIINRDKIDRVVWIVMIGYLLGIAIIVCSPGAWDRAAHGGIVIDLSFKELLASRWFIFQEKLLRFLAPLAAFAVGLGVLLWKGPGTLRRNVWTYIFLCLALVMFALGITHERAYAPMSVAAFIVVAMAVDALLKRWPLLRVAVVLVALGLSVLTTMRAIPIMKAYKAYDDQAVNEVKSAPSQAILRSRHFPNYSRFVKHVCFCSTDYYAQELDWCGYYSKENVQFVPDSVYDRYHQQRLLDGAVVLSLKSDRPDVADTVLSFPGQDYMAVVMKVDSFEHTFQQARYYFDQNSDAISAEEKERRRKYALVSDYTPYGYYPIRYQGRIYMILPLIKDQFSHIVFPLGNEWDSGEITLTRK